MAAHGPLFRRHAGKSIGSPDAPISPLRVLLLEAAKALGNLREKATIRENLFSLIFSITPALLA